MKKILKVNFIIITMFLLQKEALCQHNLDKFNAYYDSLSEARTLEFMEDKLPAWTYFVPNVGVSPYIVDGQVKFAPSVTFNLYSIIDGIKSVKKNKRKRKSIIKLTQFEKEADIKRAVDLSLLVELNKSNINIAYAKYETQKKIFKMDSISYVNNELDPEGYLRSKIALLTATEHLNQVLYKKEEIWMELHTILRH